MYPVMAYVAEDIQYSFEFISLSSIASDDQAVKAFRLVRQDATEAVRLLIEADGGKPEDYIFALLPLPRVDSAVRHLMAARRKPE